MGKVAFGHLAGLIVLLIQFAWVAAITIVIDDSDPQIRFTGPWTITADHVLNGANTNYYNGATHTTTSRGASASFTFTGTGITYYGDVDVDNADFIVQLDGVSTGHSARAGGFSSNQVLYTISGLASMQHTFSVTHNGAEGEWATLDRLVVESNAPTSTIQSTSFVTLTTVITVGGQAVTTTMTSFAGSADQAQSSETTSPSNALSAGTIAGIVVGCVAGVILIAILAFLLLRNRDEPRKEEPAPFPSPTIPSFYPTAYKGYPEPQGATVVGVGAGAGATASWYSRSSAHSPAAYAGSATSYQPAPPPPVVPGYSAPGDYNPYVDVENAPSRSSAYYSSSASAPMPQDRALSMGSNSQYDSTILYDPQLNRRS